MESDIIPFPVNLFPGITEQLVYQVLKALFGLGQPGSFLSLFIIITGKEIDHLIADIHLIIQIAAL